MKSSVTLQDIALVQMQGGTIGATVEYPGFSNRRNAERAAQRDLRALATPLLSCTVYCGQEAADLDIGDVFKLEWPDYHSGAIVMRITGMAFGDGRTDRIRIDCVQDVFGTPSAALLSDDRGSLWTNPSTPPTNVEDGDVASSAESDGPLVAGTGEIAVEMPYRVAVNVIGARNIDDYLTETPDVGLLQTSGKRPVSGLQDDGTYFGNAVNALIHVDAGSGYVQQGTAQFSPWARLAADISYLTSSIEVTEEQELSRVRVGSFAQIDEELVRIDAVTTSSSGGSTVTIGRGVLDTVPQPHSAGAAILFWEDFAGRDDVEYTTAESINVKLQPRNNSGAASLAAATAMPLTFDSRAIRPYPPGNVKVNGTAYPVAAFLPSDTITITWAHRDRLQQTGTTLLDTTDTSVGPEDGTTYALQIRDEADALVVDETGITGTEWSESELASSSSDGDPALGAGDYEATLWAVRDGYASWQAHVFSFLKSLPVASSEAPLVTDINDPVTFDCTSDQDGINDPATFICEASS